MGYVRNKCSSQSKAKCLPVDAHLNWGLVSMSFGCWDLGECIPRPQSCFMANEGSPVAQA